MDGRGRELPVLTVDPEIEVDALRLGLPISHGWRGTALDVLSMEDALASRRLRFAMRHGLVPPRRLRLFAADCADRALVVCGRYGFHADLRSLLAIHFAREFVQGRIPWDDLRAVYTGARRAYLRAGEFGSPCRDASASAAVCVRERVDPGPGLAARAVDALVLRGVWHRVRDLEAYKQVERLRVLLEGGDDV